MKVIKKNQIVIFVVALMLITAGYLNYNAETEGLIETSSVMDSEELAAVR